jgi:hypothetical protein
MAEAIQEGLNERMLNKDAQNEEGEERNEDAPVEKKTRPRRPRNEAPKAEAETEAPKAE